MRKSADAADGDRHGITLDQWRRFVAGADILSELPEAKRPAFVEWRNRAFERRREAEATARMFGG